ncbi:hypothetical protein [Streptomyces sp. NPDC014805]|uniref:hypothetical protein n=1 Tax=Streptomyces sp. NPDC014805 TaxID=3364919 RepID=UPI0036F638B4
MPPKSKVDLYAAIRPDARVGMSNRALQRRYGVGFRTVRAAMESVWPEPRQQPPPRKARVDAFKSAIDHMLRADLDAPRKRRHTVKRIFDRLLDEHGAVEVTYPMVRAYVAVRRPQIRIEAGRRPLNAFIPQTHMPGAGSRGRLRRRDDPSGRRAGQGLPVLDAPVVLRQGGVPRIFASCGQEAFFEGHVHSLSVLGGVPCGKVRYDNLRAAVARVLGLSRAWVENERWTAFRSHYGIESMYCRPGLEGAHEKGGEEGQIGWFRRNHLVRVPSLNLPVEALD